MDKKDFNENDKLENGITPEENDASVSTPEEVIEPAGTAPVPQEPVRTAPRVEESVPVMNKVGGGGTPPSSPAPSSGGKAG